MAKRRGSSKKKKLPKQDKTPTVSKQAKRTQNPEGYEHQLIAWHFRCMDAGGTWPCTVETIQSILPRLKEYEQKSWSEIKREARNHPMPTHKIEPKAQARLTTIGYGDTGELNQLDIKGGQKKQRLWGIRQENIFQILWWDPNHTVYISRVYK